MRILLATTEHLETLMQSEALFLQRFGLRPEPGYLEFPEALAFSLDKLRTETEGWWWAPRLFLHPHEPLLIGLGGYKGPPVEGTVEVGYGVATAHRGQGYATLAVARLVEEALARPGVQRVLAHTLAETSASTRVLQKSGFVRIAEVVDPEDGTIWQWQYRPSQAPTR